MHLPFHVGNDSGSEGLRTTGLELSCQDASTSYLAQRKYARCSGVIALLGKASIIH